MDWLIDILFGVTFSILGISVNMGNITESVKNVLMITPQSFSSDLWSLMVGINGALIPICKSLLFLFFLMEMVKKVTEVDKLSWEYITMLTVKYFIAGMVLINSMFFLRIILNISGDIINIVTSSITTSTIDTTSLAESLKELGSRNVITNAFNMVIVVIFWFAYIGIEVGVLTVAFSKTIKLLIYTAIAPLALSTLSNEITSSGGKRFLISYVATSLESVGILLCCLIYNIIINSVSTSSNGIGTFLAFTVANAIFLFIVNMIAPTFKEFAGA